MKVAPEGFGRGAVVFYTRIARRIPPRMTRKYGSTARVDGLASRAATCLLVLLLAAPGMSRADITVYQVAVPLKGPGAAERSEAFARALGTVAVRASGRRDAAESAAIEAAAADPSRYVQQYSTTTDRKLKVGFEARAIEQLLQQAGLPLWPAERPQTLVVFPGDGAPEREQVEQVAQQRGVTVIWPPAAATSGGAQATLVGVRSGDGFDWVLTHAGQRAQRQGSLQDGIHLAADTFAARYAPASTRGTTTASIRIGGIVDVASYAAAMKYLDSLSLVRSVAVEELTGDVVRLRVSLRGDLELLRRIAALGGPLRATAEDPTAASTVDFNYTP